MPSCRAALMQRHHELHGPRPSPLAVTNSKDSHALNKKRRPVIIYVESPKVVHAHASEFRSVVQRLTGAPPPPSRTAWFSAPAPALPPHAQFPFQLYAGGLASEALITNGMDCCRASSQFAAVSPPPMAAAAPVFTSYLPGEGRSDQLISPAFLFDQSMAPAVAGPSSFQANSSNSSNLQLLSSALHSIGGANRFIDQ